MSCVLSSFFIKQTTAYELRISDWGSDVCSSDLFAPEVKAAYHRLLEQGWTDAIRRLHPGETIYSFWKYWRGSFERNAGLRIDHLLLNEPATKRLEAAGVDTRPRGWEKTRSEAHTSELQSLMRISSDVFCLKKKTK